MKRLFIYLFALFLASSAYSQTWTQKNQSPSGRAYPAMARVEGTDKVVLFGGEPCSDETWVFDIGDNKWTQMHPINNIKPSAKKEHCMSYLGDDKVLLYGGNNQGSNETWIYDLSENSWTLAVPANSTNPGNRSGLGLCNIGNNKVLLFGGQWANVYDRNTWIYDYQMNTWTEVIPSSGTAPQGRCKHGLSFVGGDKAILFGGNQNLTYFDNTWVYDLSDNKWTAISPTGNVKPQTMSKFSMCQYNSDQVILYGGTNATSKYYDTWVYDLSDNAWTKRLISDSASAPAIDGGAMIYSAPNTSMFFGGLYSISYNRDENWIYNGQNNSWSKNTLISNDKPPTRFQNGLSYIGDDKILLYGGLNSAFLNDTWVYDQSENIWTRLNPSAPIDFYPRNCHVMCYSSDDRIVLFSGNINTSPSINTLTNEMWQFDLSDNAWTKISPTNGIIPPARNHHSLCKISNDKILLFGGIHATGYPSDTWIYEISTQTWTQINIPANSGPSSRYGMSSCQITDGKVLIFGGLTVSGVDNQTWIFDLSNNSWTQITPKNGIKPAESQWQAMASLSEGRVLLFGDGNSGHYTDDTWIFDIKDNSWTKVACSAKPLQRWYQNLCSFGFNHKALLFGGSVFNPIGSYLSSNDFWLFEEPSNAPPITSYAIPDIAAPGMNTYLEILGATDAVNTFGPDMKYHNNPGDLLRVELVNPADTNKVIFGPCVVSWEGRMISTQALVNPKIKPNSWEWDKLNPEFVIKYRVFYNGEYSPELTLYLVNPCPLGDKSASAERVLGAGTLGKRSPRGAMLVDKLKLASATYTVSTTDCDPNTAGNQGYLPFVLIAKDSITGQANTLIDVSGGTAVSGHAGNGGPGAGGGGGRFYDGTSDVGDDGGSGYVSGGPGGRNRTLPIGSDRFVNWGDGSGPGGNGLSGVAKPPTGAYEAAGGGTGHPFGFSGKPCYVGANSEIGQYGGGSGPKQNSSGGSAGYATDGNGTDNTGGKAHGNIMCVPMAGGSGGASGNPQQLSSYSGSGGGGGGAIVVYAPIVKDVAVKSVGGNGNDGNGGSHGGAGSGGFIGTYAKISYLNTNNPSLNVTGGTNKANKKAGNGRLRWDVPVTSLAPANGDYTFFAGPSSDTTQFFHRGTFKIKGSKAQSETLVVYVKRNGENWATPFIILGGLNQWEINLTTAPFDKDSIIYVCAVQQEASPASAVYNYEPPYVLSQAACNILILEKTPDIAGDTLIKDTLIHCPGTTNDYSAKIYNWGEAALNLGLSSAYFKHNKLSLITNTNLSINPLDSNYVRARVTLGTTPAGIIRDTLVIPNNDPDAKSNPWYIAFEIHTEEATVYTEHVSTNGISLANPTVVVGVAFDLCIGESITIGFKVYNDSKFSFNLRDVLLSQYGDYSVNYTGPDYLKPNSSAYYEVYFKTNQKGLFTTKVKYKYDECDNLIEGPSIGIRTINPDLVFLDDGLFPDTRVGQYNEKNIRIKNSGDANAFITSIANPSSEFIIMSIIPSLPLVLEEDSILTVRIRFAPSVPANPATAWLRVRCALSDTSCIDIDSLLLQSKSVASQVYVSKYFMDFDTLHICTGAMDTVYVGNPKTSTANFNLTKQPKIIGSNMFEIVSQPASYPHELAPGDSVMFTVRYKTGTNGFVSAEMQIYTDDAVDTLVTVNIQGFRESPGVTITPALVSITDMPIGAKVTGKIKLHNTGFLPLTLLSSEVTLNSDNTGNTITPKTGTIAGLDSLEFDYELTVRNAGLLQYLFHFVFKECTLDAKFTPVNITGENAVVNISQTKDFGILSACEDSTANLFITNNGKVPFALNEVSVVGTDASMFIIMNISATLPDTLHPGDTVWTVVRFSPSFIADGNKSAQLRFRIFADNASSDVLINLTGTKASTFLASPANVEFGNRVVGASYDLPLTLTNSGNFGIAIENTYLKNGAPLSFAPAMPYSPVPPGGGTLNFTVSFTPVGTGDYSDTLVVAYIFNSCRDTVRVKINARAVPARKLIIEMPKVVLADPRINNYELPVYITVEKDTISNLKIDSIEIRWDKSLFVPSSVSQGRIVANKTLGAQRALTLAFDDVDVLSADTKTILTLINGTMMLGSTDSTKLDIRNTVCRDNLRVSEIEEIDGSLSIAICSQGGDRLLVPEEISGIVADPNPSNGTMAIYITATEIGHHTVELYDLTGHLVQTLAVWDRQLGESNYKPLGLYLDIPSGTYMLVLKTPTESKSVQIVIVK